MLVFAIKLHWFPSLSSIRPTMHFGDQLMRMVLPVLTLTLVILAHMMRNTRAAIISVMSRPFIDPQPASSYGMRCPMWLGRSPAWLP